MRMLLLTIATAWLTMLPLSAEACSLEYSIQDRADRLVMIARVAGYVTADWENETAHGIAFEAVEAYQNAERNDVFEVFPATLAADCNWVYFGSVESAAEAYPPGAYVAVHSLPHSDYGPGNHNPLLYHGISLLDAECTPEVTARLTPDYRDHRICGGLFFQAYRELAGMADLSADRRIEVLGRLADIPVWMNYEELVARYIDDPDYHRPLLRQRYGELLELECDASTEGFSYESAGRMRERCALNQ